MRSGRIFRLIEASLVILFFIQASRIVFGMLLGLLTASLESGQISPSLVYLHLAFLVVLLPSWFSPKGRSLLPELLRIATVIVVLSRLIIALPLIWPFAGLYAAFVIMGVGGVYQVSLLRLNRRTWLSSVVIGSIFDQLLRAKDTFDLSLQSAFELSVLSVRYAIPVIVLQIILALFCVGAGFLAYRLRDQEVYDPAYLSPPGGLAVGAFFALHQVVLGMPNVVSHWASIPYEGLVPWLILATVLPLLPLVRRLLGETLGMFDYRSRGWVWLIILLLLIVIGNRLEGIAAAGSLVVARFLSVMLFWWIPTLPDSEELEQVGPSFSLSILTLALLIYGYSLTFEYAQSFNWLRGQTLILVLIMTGLLALARLPWREDDPWLEAPSLASGLAPIFLIMVVSLSLFLVRVSPESDIVATQDVLRVASYNINGGYDNDGVFQLEFAGDSVEASLADVIILQEVDAGRPVSYGIDQAYYLSRRFGMDYVYQAETEFVRGVAILSRWPIIAQDALTLPSESNEVVALSVLVQGREDRQVTIIGVRLFPSTDEERQSQLGILFNLVPPDSPTILGIDLSASPNDPAYEHIIVSGSFFDPDSVLGVDRGYTYPADSPTVRYDYIFTRGLQPLTTNQVRSDASDHRLVVIEVIWP